MSAVRPIAPCCVCGSRAHPLEPAFTGHGPDWACADGEACARRRNDAPVKLSLVESIETRTLQSVERDGEP